MRSRAVLRAVRLALAAGECRSAELSVVLADDATLSRLHDEYLGMPGPTDVLTFDLGEPGDQPGHVAGEIVLSVPFAAREAAQRDLPVEHEVILYAVHGVLHLLGYDDRTAAQARKMHAKEDMLLTELGLGPVYAAPRLCASR